MRGKEKGHTFARPGSTNGSSFGLNGGGNSLGEWGGHTFPHTTGRDISSLIRLLGRCAWTQRL